MIIAPSVLSADFSRLGEDIQLINESEAAWFHVDIMDGVFVPNISFGFPIMESLKKYARKPLDVHLMIVQPERYLERFKEAGAAHIHVHVEACTHLHRVLGQIRDVDIKSGVAINPHTPVVAIEEVLELCDIVNVMSVNPGFGGQKFIESSLYKIAKLREIIDRKNLNTTILVDGGVNLANAAKLLQHGAHALVVGNAVFGSEHPKEVIRELSKM